jgi:hypothetical protein
MYIVVLECKENFSCKIFPQFEGSRKTGACVLWCWGQEEMFPAKKFYKIELRHKYLTSLFHRLATKGHDSHCLVRQLTTDNQFFQSKLDKILQPVTE